MWRAMKTNDQYLAHFETYLATEKRVSHNTFSAYKTDILQLLEYLSKSKKNINNCTTSHLKKFLQHLKKRGLSAKSLSRKVSSIKLFFSFLHEQNWVKNKAISLIFPKIEQTLPIYLTEKEIEQLFEVADKDTSYRGIRNKVALYLLYAAGMRVSELVNLTIDSIHFDTGFINILGKGNKERMVPLPKNILDLLRMYLDVVIEKLIPKNAKPAAVRYVFPTVYKKEVKPVSRQLLWILLNKIIKKTGITKKISPHSLRHSLATHLLKNGANIRSLQLLLGHEQLTTVQIYTHLENKQVREIYDKKHPRA
jgi:integrase/recombinase XerD